MTKIDYPKLPFPGSNSAKILGCTCSGRMLTNQYWITSTCPVHSIILDIYTHNLQSNA